MLRPSTARAASPITSDSVGWGWTVAPISHAVAVLYDYLEEFDHYFRHMTRKKRLKKCLHEIGRAHV